MQRKALAAVEWKADKAGAFRAIFSTLNVVDHDKDVTLAGAFKNGQEVVISAYMHKSWDGALPVGKGVINSDSTKAWVDGEFFDTAAGQETYKTVKALDKLGEWSYGFDPTLVSTDAKDLEAYPGAERILKEIDTFEVSPVLKGAGINTMTQSIKTLKAGKFAAALKAGAVPANAGTLQMLAQLDDLSDQLDVTLDALLAMLGIPDPDEPGGPAELDGNEPVNLPADAPRNTSVTLTTPAPLADVPAPANVAALVVSPVEFVQLPKGFRYPDHGESAQAAASLITSFVTRSKALVALRVKEGRTLSAANRDRLANLQAAIASASADLNELLSSTDLNDGKSASDADELSKIWLNVQRLNPALVGISEE